MTCTNNQRRRVASGWVHGFGAERAASTVELVMLLPLAMLAVVVLAWAGRGPSAVGETVAAANAASRAAALASDPAGAVAAVERAGSAMSIEACQSLRFDVDTSRWGQGWVSVEATCVPKTHGLEPLGVDDPIVRRSVEQLQQWGSRG